MNIEMNMEFPCGYKIRYHYDGFLVGFASIKFDDKDIPVCPIHKEKCKKPLNDG